MRPPRVAILVLFFSASLFLVCRSISSIRRPNPAATSSPPQKSSFRSLFSFTAPFSLFPPSAAISLTEDNSTFFAARPAAFGPPLPSNGLSGQLWIGSGFTDETLQEGEGEGELGCSDIPGWEDGRLKLAIKATEQALASSKSAVIPVDTKNSKRDDLAKGPLVDRVSTEKEQPQSQPKPTNDGTDDYLHQGFQQPRSSYNGGSTSSGSSHADIQSMQETAEITGKIALLSRGGCGFLEKVKWAQRRGAIALIVGDNQKGGPLIQMFARGNVDNVTIPSVFTSRTTAHLLSSLMQPGSFIEDILDENGNPILKVQQSAKAGRTKRSALPKRDASRVPSRMPPPRENSRNKRSQATRRSWFSELFHWGESRSTASDHSRPPSSGQLDWVLVDDWNDENDKLIKNSLDRAAKDSGKSNTATDYSKPSGDGFQIGVQDWRDPDLVGPSAQSGDSSSQDSRYDDIQSSNSEASARQAGSGSSADIGGPRGGSITPGSGEYVPGVADDPNKPGPGNSDSSTGARGGLLSKIFGDHDDTDAVADVASTETAGSPAGTSASTFTAPGGNDGANDREGLWVTITPTGSASPFFDTLLVLVISPLVTLTIVYALLILRVKIRMRRWRAPKSVVDRLPVRTYHTVAPSPSQSPRAPSPTSSSPTTPLLQGPSRSRPRSRTTTGVPESGDLLRVDDALQASRTPSHEKNQRRGSSEWKKYMGRQVECVVCLEEYVDGVSRVMSLPCGHEFHAECITPWLTTRRRTCPICKGDVVRSLARASGSGPQYEPFREDPYDSSDGSETFQDRPPSPNQLEDDLERGPSFAQAPRQEWQANRHDVWFSALASRFGGGSSLSARPEGSGADRSR
ncbi:E3 ubiquitin-protein ligase RNF13 [Madurella fahalii]|uniref:RING-type E3 ubiquitin transferase n=1 Tax=Madurella fahalii TaxID=1157608 RepID=A0ABQ0G2R4_9PEZI